MRELKLRERIAKENKIKNIKDLHLVFFRSIPHSDRNAYQFAEVRRTEDRGHLRHISWCELE